jgi:hypothetical protein
MQESLGRCNRIFPNIDGNFGAERVRSREQNVPVTWSINPAEVKNHPGDPTPCPQPADACNRLLCVSGYRGSDGDGVSDFRLGGVPRHRPGRKNEDAWTGITGQTIQVGGGKLNGIG